MAYILLNVRIKPALVDFQDIEFESAVHIWKVEIVKCNSLLDITIVSIYSHVSDRQINQCITVYSNLIANFTANITNGCSGVDRIFGKGEVAAPLKKGTIKTK